MQAEIITNVPLPIVSISDISHRYFENDLFVKIINYRYTPNVILFRKIADKCRNGYIFGVHTCCRFLDREDTRDETKEIRSVLIRILRLSKNVSMILISSRPSEKHLIALNKNCNILIVAILIFNFPKHHIFCTRKVSNNSVQRRSPQTQVSE